MRILFLDQFSEMGGAQRGLLDIACAAVERGWTARVAIPGSGPLREHLRARNIEVVEIPCGPYRSGSKSLADMFRFALDVRRQAKILASMPDFDLLYVNGPRLLPVAAMEAFKRAPVLFHAHSSIPAGPSMRLAGWSLRRPDAAVVACSNFVAQPLRAHVQASKLHVIPNGVREIPHRERSFYFKDHVRVGLIGRISREKGQAEFVRTAALLAPRFPGVEFVICGAPLFGDRNYADAVRRSASGFPIEFTGWQEDVASVLGALDILAVPSKDEGMGRVIVEAFAAGVPVVAFPSGGIPEVVTDNQTGFLTRDATPEALADRIREILTSGPATVQKVVQNARSAWERCYTVANFQSRITDLMQGVVSSWVAERETRLRPPRRVTPRQP